MGRVSSSFEMRREMRGDIHELKEALITESHTGEHLER
jgi:hypothetical protein